MSEQLAFGRLRRDQPRFETIGQLCARRSPCPSATSGTWCQRQTSDVTSTVAGWGKRDHKQAFWRRLVCEACTRSRTQLYRTNPCAKRLRRGRDRIESVADAHHQDTQIRACWSCRSQGPWKDPSASSHSEPWVVETVVCLPAGGRWMVRGA